MTSASPSATKTKTNVVKDDPVIAAQPASGDKSEDANPPIETEVPASAEAPIEDSKDPS